MVLKEGGGPLCSPDCDPSSRSLSLKVSAQGTNEPLGWERSIQCCPGVMAVPGFSPLFFYSPLCQLAVPYANWQSTVPIGSPLCQFAVPFANWQSPMPIGSPLCQSAVPYANWQSHMPIGSPLCQLAVPSLEWQTPVPSGSSLY